MSRGAATVNERDQEYVVRIYFQRLPNFMEFLYRFHGMVFAYGARSEIGCPVARLVVEADSEASALERVADVLAEMIDVEVLRLAIEH
jgi:hypothetical protein